MYALGVPKLLLRRVDDEKPGFCIVEAWYAVCEAVPICIGLLESDVDGEPEGVELQLDVKDILQVSLCGLLEVKCSRKSAVE